MTTIRVVWIMPFAVAMLAAGFAIGSWHKSSPSGNKSVVSSGSLARSDRTGAATVARHTTPEPTTRSVGGMNAPPTIIARLTALKVVPQDPRSVRALLFELEKLRELGSAAVPAIRDFLAGGADVDYNIPLARVGRNGSVPLDFSVPPSLRLGLFEVLKNIGGPEAESVLLRELQTTGRGVEV